MVLWVVHSCRTKNIYSEEDFHFHIWQVRNHTPIRLHLLLSSIVAVSVITIALDAFEATLEVSLLEIFLIRAIRVSVSIELRKEAKIRVKVLMPIAAIDCVLADPVATTDIIIMTSFRIVKI